MTVKRLLPRRLRSGGRKRAAGTKQLLLAAASLISRLAAGWGGA